MKKIKKDLSELIQSSIALLFLYNYVAHVVNHASQFFTGDSSMVMLKTVIKFTFCREGIIDFADYLDSLCALMISCVVGAIILYYILKWVCETDWVKEPIQIEECWKEVKWYNPFSWAWVLVCVIKESFRWVLQKICGWKEIIVWGLGIICAVLVIAAFL